MPLKTWIIDRLTGNKASVDNHGGLLVTGRSVPEADYEHEHLVPYQSYLETAAGSSNMVVNGSTTNVDFYVAASENHDVWIKTISVQVADGSSTLAKFGGLAALTNGCALWWEEPVHGKIQISGDLKTNADLMRLSQGTPSFGDAATAFQWPNIGPPGVPVIGYIPSIDLARIYGPPWGLRLRRGSKARLGITVRDDLTGISQFDTIVYGVQREPDEPD
jgi:hypothetical protein